MDRYADYLHMHRQRLFRLFSESGWIAVGSMVSVVGSLVLVRVLTEKLLPAEYGRLTLALTLGTLACQVAFAGSMPGIMRYYTLAAERDQLLGYFRASANAIMVSSGYAIGGGSLIAAGLYVCGASENWGVTLVAVFLSVLMSLNSTFNAIQNAARQRRIVALVGSVDAVLKIALVTGILIWVGNTAGSVLLAYILTLLIVLTLQAKCIKPLFSATVVMPGHAMHWRNEIWLYSKPYVYFNLFTWGQANSDRWALEMFAGTSEVGLYATLLQLGWAPIAMVTSLATTLLGPIIFARSGDARDAHRNAGVHRFSWQLTYLTLALTGLCVVAAWLFHSLLFALLVGKSYRQVSYLLPWMILAGGLFAASQVLGLKMQSELKTTEMIRPKIVSSMLGIGFNFVGVYWYGLPGVVGGMVCFSLVHMLWFAHLARRVS